MSTNYNRLRKGLEEFKEDPSIALAERLEGPVNLDVVYEEE